MILNTKALDIMFRRISVEEIIHGLERERKLIDKELYRGLFLRYAAESLHGYSINEQENVYALLQTSLKANTFPKSVILPFHALFQVADKLLIRGNVGPECKFAEIINWRDAYFLLGQDIFTCSWLAAQSKTHSSLPSFAWPAVIPSENRILARITAGAAENHMHLYAGASVFSLSWACLMNHPKSVPDIDTLEDLLQSRSIKGVSGNLWPMKRKMLYAAKLRECLFLRLQGDKTPLMSQLCSFHKLYTDERTVSEDLEKEIEILRFQYGLAFEQPDFRGSVCLDYAFTAKLNGDADSNSRLLASERYLLFSIFEKVFLGELSEGDQWLFYIYLLLKAQLRNELVQVNQQIGFANFYKYDRRKKLIWKPYEEYLNEDIRQSVNAHLKEQRLSALEGRVCPKETSDEDIAFIHKLDRAAIFYDADSFGKESVNCWASSFFMENEAKERKNFFVFHFPKEKDDPIPENPWEVLHCRHDRLRKQIRRDGIALADALANCPYLCERIRGIDACSHEIVCRPEIFGPLFRFLRSYRSEDYWKHMYRMGRPRLGASYHVGEDFLDIADGLRAVDEAIRFLDLRYGDRFGHALVLGVDPKQHYLFKHKQSVLSKQELLDDLVWVCFRSPELGIEIPNPLFQQLNARAYLLFRYVYESEAHDSKIETSSCDPLYEYYQSMYLRGDDPRCYSTGEYHAITLYDMFDCYCENTVSDQLHCLEEYRKNKTVSRLYYRYHYDYKVRHRGAEMDSWMVDSAYIKLMNQLQQAMRNLVNQRGISIECNPSSNVLIGTFKKYIDHPILVFNNAGLNGLSSMPQLHVSVNTDNPGVFDTTVQFEYALLAKALIKLEDEDGQPMNSERQVEDYLRSLVRMGQEQVFPPCQ